MPVNKLLIQMSVPMMISMLVQALYNIVDSMFVAQLSENALTAVSLAFPVQNLMIAVGSGTGVGLNALVSRALGEKKSEYASRAASNGIWLYLFSTIAFAALSAAFGGLFFRVQTQNAEILRYGSGYIHVVGIFSIGLFMQMCFERLLQSTGNTIYSMITQSLGAVINIILDPIMIFGLFGFPRLEVVGAGVATVCGQVIAAGLAIFFNLKKNRELELSLKKYKPDGSIIRAIYNVGVPSIIMASIGSIMTFGMNKILMAFTSTATAVFGVYYKLQSFVFMPVFGMNNGMVPIVAYNFGAKKPDRIVQTMKLGIMYAISIMAVGTIIFQVFPGPLLRIFNASDNMLQIGIPALRIISIHFIIAGFCIVCLSILQALGHGLMSLISSVLRQLVVLLPSAFILARTGGLDAIWWSFVVAEAVSAVYSAICMRHVYTRQIKPMKNRDSR